MRFSDSQPQSGSQLQWARVMGPHQCSTLSFIFRLSDAATAAAAAAALPLRWLSRGRLPLSRRTRSLEVLSLGREQSAPYLPGKQPLPTQLASLTEEQHSRRQLVAQRWQRACRALMQGREVAGCIDLLGNRLAPSGDRLHAAVVLKARLAACPAAKQRRLAWALLARRRAGRVGCREHALNELFITGAISGPSVSACVACRWETVRHGAQ